MFRRHFYHGNHQIIKTSFKDNPNIQILDIRLAPVNEYLQNIFMIGLNIKSYFPSLVYHGTKLDNIESILRYGLFIPNQAHPSNSEPPIIRSAHGRSFGTEIYSSQTADYSISYLKKTNALLGCAPVSRHKKLGKIQG